MHGTKTNSSAPLAIFDVMEHIESPINFNFFSANYNQDDINKAQYFLSAYTGSKGTFNSYRREIERLLQWSALIQKKSLTKIGRQEIEDFLLFCQSPPTNWISTKKPPRYINNEGRRLPNPQWRPFVSTISKAARRKGDAPEIKNFSFSHGALRETFAILSSFFNFLVQEEYVESNPVALIRQKSQFLRKKQGAAKIRRLSELQWQTVIKTAEKMAVANPEIHERTLFIMSALYSMYLRISELTETPRWSPCMNDFRSDSDQNWWFTTVGKGNKERQIAVSNAMLLALKRWRQYLGLSALPSPADNSPLIAKQKGSGGIKSSNMIRKIVQHCFDEAINSLVADGLQEESETLNEATVHWLRHTGISDDVKTRPREHVRDDAGHSSSAITDVYIDIEHRERHRTAQKKIISEED